MLSLRENTWWSWEEKGRVVGKDQERTDRFWKEIESLGNGFCTLYSLERKKKREAEREKRLDKVGERKRAKGKMVKKERNIYWGENPYIELLLDIYNIYKG